MRSWLEMKIVLDSGSLEAYLQLRLRRWAWMEWAVQQSSSFEDMDVKHVALCNMM